MTPRAVKPWSREVGFLPFKVTVYEEPTRKGFLYLRWRADGNWRRLSLRRPLRTPRGKIDLANERYAMERAAEKYAELVAGRTAADVALAVPLTILAGLERATNAAAGKYPTDSLHRREVVREVTRAAEVWGASTAWAMVRRVDLRRLWRARIAELRAGGHDGLRGAEVTVARVLAVARWLRDEDLIPADACVPSSQWKQELRDDWLQLTASRSLPDPKRPRHTLADMRAILRVAGDVDPRLELALALGAELRLGQVIRLRRSDVDREHRTFTLHGRGHKRGVVVKLTDGQDAVLEQALTVGYLAPLEAGAPDYPLFPAGQMPGNRKGRGTATVARHAGAPPIDRSVLDDWFRAAETLAEVPHQKGRGAYGLRRVAVDAAKGAGISREGLMQHGGWSDTQVPDRIYAEQQTEQAQDEARDVRAKIRGEPE